MTVKSCPRCGSELILDITYGLPGPDAYENKSFFSGGCCLDSDSPAYHCKSCRYQFGYAIPDDENNIRDRELRKLFEKNRNLWDRVRRSPSFYENDNKEYLANAFSIALDAHEGQFDKGGREYIHHCIDVMGTMDSIEESVTGLLHDVIEDSNWTFKKLKDEGISDEIITAIDSVTKRKSEDYFDFINRAKLNKIGRRVKAADLLYNLNIKRISNPTKKDFVRTDKYKMAAEILIRNDSKIDFNISPVKNKKDIQNRILNFLYPDIDEDLYLK